MFSPGTLAWIQNTIPIFGNHADNILPEKLWVGDIAAAHDRKWLKETGITHIVSVTSFSSKDVVIYPNDFYYYTVFAHDDLQTNLMRYWAGTSQFIDHAIKSGGRVFVHCKFGRSRSVATVAAYLISKLEYTAQESLELLRLKRPVSSPNSFFVFQLYLWNNIYKRHCQ